MGKLHETAGIAAVFPSMCVYMLSMASALTAPRRWEAELRVLPSGRIAVQLVDDEHATLTVCPSPSAAICTIEEFLRAFRCWHDELVLWSRSDMAPPQMWTTRSSAGGLYWCTVVLGKLWPPPWVPLIERRGTRAFAGVPPFEAPLLERRGVRRPRVAKQAAH
jgi:hypothetical protein